MEMKYYVTMAYDVAQMDQSDYLYLMSINDGGLIGYSGEFDLATYDIEKACSPNDHGLAEWFRLPDEIPPWRPAKMDEIKALKLDKFVLGSKEDTKVTTPIVPL